MLLMNPFSQYFITCSQNIFTKVIQNFKKRPTNLSKKWAIQNSILWLHSAIWK